MTRACEFECSKCSKPVWQVSDFSFIDFSSLRVTARVGWPDTISIIKHSTPDMNELTHQFIEELSSNTFAMLQLQPESRDSWQGLKTGVQDQDPLYLVNNTFL